MRYFQKRKTTMPEDYLQMGVVAAFSAMLSSTATVMQFKPRLARAAKDIIENEE